MDNIDNAINREMGSITSRSYIFITLLVGLFALTKPPDVNLLVFSSPPATALESNPNARNAQTIITEWDLTESRSWITGLLQSLFYVGFMPGAIIIGQFSDRFGRRKISWIVYSLILLSQIAAGLCQSWVQFAVCRTFLGFFTGGMSVVTAIFTQELCGSNLWVINGAIASIAFTTNTLLYMIVIYYIPSWRSMHFVTAIPGILGFVYLYFTPESPRWLHSNGRIEEAEKTIMLFAKWNGSKNTDYQLLVKNQDDEDIPKASRLKNKIVSAKKSVVDILKQPVLRYRALILSLQWFTSSFVYYCITLGAGSFSSNYYLAYLISSVSQLPSIPVVVFLMEKKWSGRRRTLTGLMLLTGISVFLMYIIPFKEEHSSYKLILLLLGKFGITGSFDLIYIYTAELFPTVVRNVGLGSMSTCARVGGIIAPFISNFVATSGSTAPFLSYGILCCLCGMVASFLPETRGKAIINTIEDAYHHEEENDDVL